MRKQEFKEKKHGKTLLKKEKGKMGVKGVKAKGKEERGMKGKVNIAKKGREVNRGYEQRGDKIKEGGGVIFVI